MKFEKSLSVSELTAQLKGLIESSYSSVFGQILRSDRGL